MCPDNFIHATYLCWTDLNAQPFRVHGSMYKDTAQVTPSHQAKNLQGCEVPFPSVPTVLPHCRIADRLSNCQVPEHHAPQAAYRTCVHVWYCTVPMLRTVYASPTSERRRLPGCCLVWRLGCVAAGVPLVLGLTSRECDFFIFLFLFSSTTRRRSEAVASISSPFSFQDLCAI